MSFTKPWAYKACCATIYIYQVAFYFKLQNIKTIKVTTKTVACFYNSEPADANDLWNRIQITSDVIRNDPVIFQSVRDSLIRRARACLQQNGGNFEYLL